MKYIEVIVDQNDADYNTKVTPINEEDLNTIKPLIHAIKNFKPYVSGNWTHRHNYPWGEYLPRTDLNERFIEEIYPDVPKDVIELFEEEFIPYGEHGFHSIKSIRVFEIVNEEILFEYEK
jgi:hypothetical protein